MNLIPIAIGATVVAVVPPLRQRVVPVATATAGAVASTGSTAVLSAIGVVAAAAEGAVAIGRAAVQGPTDSTEG